jgi:CDP-glycerol glycerophosphotransferase (TagB/SpsB family)
MNISDDTVLQFFRDLVRDFSQPHFSEAEFLQQQYAVIEAYVEHFPANERDSRALAWIEANAGQYRQQWHLQAASGGRQMQSNRSH